MLDYTSIYRRVYSVIKTDKIPHEEAHKASLRIANALSDIYIYSMEQPPEITDIIIETIEAFENKSILSK